MTESMDDTRQAAVSGRAWDEFCDALKDAGRFVVDHSSDEVDRVEGFRYLSRLTRGGLDAFLESGSPAYPRITTLPYMVKIGCDNPDAFYQRVSVSGDHSYRISGPRGNVAYLGIGAYSGGFGLGAGTPTNQGYIEDNDADPSRCIEILASREEPASLADHEVWLPMGPETSIIIIRQFSLDRTAERPAELIVECLDPPASAPPAFSAADLVHGLAMSSLFVQGVSQRFMSWVEDIFSERPNTLEELPKDDGPAGWGDPNQIFRHGYWGLEPGEALVVGFTPPECRYWNFQLNNLWEESLDYRYFAVTVNKHTARLEPDGSVRIIVAPIDPGVGNWIDSGDRAHGTMGLRFNQAVRDAEVTCEVVELDRLSGA